MLKCDARKCPMNVCWWFSYCKQYELKNLDSCRDVTPKALDCWFTISVEVSCIKGLFFVPVISSCVLACLTISVMVLFCLQTLCLWYVCVYLCVQHGCVLRCCVFEGEGSSVHIWTVCSTKKYSYDCNVKYIEYSFSVVCSISRYF